jgi:hypothetical protein
MRLPTQPSKASKIRRLNSKRKASDTKKLRSCSEPFH